MRNKNIVPRRYLDREEAILDFARGRSVLHLGCVGHVEESLEERVQLAEKTLHWTLTKEADTTGVDYSAEVVDQYRRLGIFDNIVAGDVQRLDEVAVSGFFDVVVAADIIEHLSNPGSMLDGIKRFCGRDTRVLITTPHAFGLPNYLRFLLGRFRDGPEHVMTFNIDNICNLLQRHGYEIERIDTCHQSHARRYGLIFGIASMALKVRPRLGGTIFIVARVTPA